MSERLTDNEMADFVVLLDCARADGDPDSDAGQALDDFLDSNIKRIADELIERRAADLSTEDREALRAFRRDMRAAGVIPGYPPHERALAVLDRLIGQGEKR